MSAANIARALGGGLSGSGWHRCRCPVHNGQRDSLALQDRADGLFLRCHAGCHWSSIRDKLKRLGLLEANDSKPPKIDEAELKRQREAEAVRRRIRIANALDMWSDTVSANETLVETYLWSRLICIDAPPVIRLYRSLWHKESGQRRPAMMALVENPEFGPVGVHATYLAIDGSCKATLDPVRKSFGPVGGGAVRLAPVGDDGILVVGEGIETTLSFMIATGAPGWAALFADNIAKVVLPPEAKRIIIAADHDANGTGQRAAQQAAFRFRQQGRSVRVCVPPAPGDFNDILACRIPAMGGPCNAA